MSGTGRQKRLGIIGGLGPVASSELYLRVVRGALARTGGQYPDVVMHSIPVHTDMESAFIEGRASGSTQRAMLALLSDATATLVRSGADAIALPCNTLHAYVDELPIGPGTVFIDMVSATLAEVRNGGYRRPAFLGTTSTRTFRVYEQYAEGIAIAFVRPPAPDQAVVADAIEALVRDPDDPAARARLSGVVGRLERLADSVLLACTDLGAVPLDHSLGLPVVDSLSALASACVDYVCAPSAAPGRLVAAGRVPDRHGPDG